MIDDCRLDRETAWGLVFAGGNNRDRAIDDAFRSSNFDSPKLSLVDRILTLRSVSRRPAVRAMCIITNAVCLSSCLVQSLVLFVDSPSPSVAPSQGRSPVSSASSTRSDLPDNYLQDTSCYVDGVEGKSSLETRPLLACQDKISHVRHFEGLILSYDDEHGLDSLPNIALNIAQDGYSGSPFATPS